MTGFNLLYKVIGLCCFNIVEAHCCVIRERKSFLGLRQLKVHGSKLLIYCMTSMLRELLKKTFSFMCYFASFANVVSASVAFLSTVELAARPNCDARHSICIMSVIMYIHM